MTNETYVTTPHGQLCARPSKDPQKPGIEILLLPAFSDEPLRLALVEYSDTERAEGLSVPASRQADSVEDDRWGARILPGIITKAWGDGTDKDWTGRTVHHNYLTDVPEDAVAVQARGHIYAGVHQPDAQDEAGYLLTDVRALSDPYISTDIAPSRAGMRIPAAKVSVVWPLRNL